MSNNPITYLALNITVRDQDSEVTKNVPVLVLPDGAVLLESHCVGYVAESNVGAAVVEMRTLSGTMVMLHKAY